MTAHALDWSPFPRDNAIGDPGRQPEVKAVGDALNVGVPDTAVDFLSLDSFEIRGCSTRGWSHRYKGTPRQDSFSLLTNDDLVVVAVADGVSQGEYSQVAAETAARSACKLVADQVAKNGSVDWVQLARRISLRIIEEGEYRLISRPPGDEPTTEDRLRSCLAKMSTTLIVAVVHRQPGPNGFAAEIGVVAGDSAAYLLRQDSEVLVPVGGGKTGAGPITSTSVHPLPGPVEPAVVHLVLEPGEALFVGSDGIGDPVGDGTGEVGREYARRWGAPPFVDQFLLDVNVYRRSFDDDRTAVGLWVRPDVTLPEATAAVDDEPPVEGDSDVTTQASVAAAALDAQPDETGDEQRSQVVILGLQTAPTEETPPAQVEAAAQVPTSPEDPTAAQDADELVAILDALVDPAAPAADEPASVEPADTPRSPTPNRSDFRPLEFPKES